MSDDTKVLDAAELADVARIGAELAHEWRPRVADSLEALQTAWAIEGLGGLSLILEIEMRS